MKYEVGKTKNLTSYFLLHTSMFMYMELNK